MSRQISGDCDCCGCYRNLTQCFTPDGLETWACAACRGEDERDDQHDHDRKLRYESEG